MGADGTVTANQKQYFMLIRNTHIDVPRDFLSRIINFRSEIIFTVSYIRIS